VLLSLLSRIASFGALPFFVLWLQGPVGLSATATGLAMLAMSLPVLLLSFVGARLQRLVPARTLIGVGNLAGVAAGLALLFGIAPDSGWTAALPGFVLIGVSAGLVFPSLMGLAVGVVPPERAGLASGVANTFFPLGTAIGVAVFGVVLAAAADRAGLTGTSREATLAGTGDASALVAGLHGIAAGMAALSALGVLVAVVMVRERDRLPTP
jgi:MFS family permease